MKAILLKQSAARALLQRSTRSRESWRLGRAMSGDFALLHTETA